MARRRMKYEFCACPCRSHYRSEAMKSRGHLFLRDELSKIGNRSNDNPLLVDRERRGRKQRKRTTKDDDKNGFGSQDGQEVPNNRERIARKTAKLV